MTPTEKHRETAAAVATKAIGGCMFETADNWTAQKDWATEVIAAALAKAKREGREAERARCADIVERFAPGGDLYSEDFIDNDVATRVAIRGEILSEAGEE